MENETKFSSKDLYLSCVILASGHDLIAINKITNKFVSFEFDISQEKAKRIIQKHWNRELLLPTRNLIEAIHEIKTRTHATL
ncbi:hypothetical protein COY87_05000 [Candidatus Roizmanbacteria bacterium CG_4_10_14_0_8_um_filter_33_9]|uniref:DUF5659 domain-containing protein n=1 Tax=Candidatus Roizmanbacteria bacterium CG_4_10_14_0_8_um_filter_33_9 TaxID=1974826 RepID=A0A2M7QIG3_9BACT|nr:MAG: hypothetical protein COY87_05000 [Candidatus Roizmanbacteria bacterium CG_4_10_14_0_8_um_filter_33_9]